MTTTFSPSTGDLDLAPQEAMNNKADVPVKEFVNDDFYNALEDMNKTREEQFGIVRDEPELEEVELTETILAADIEKYGLANFMGKLSKVMRQRGYEFFDNKIVNLRSGKAIKF